MSIHDPEAPRRPFIKLTTIPATATAEEAEAIIWAAFYATQAENEAEDARRLAQKKEETK